MTFLQMLPRSFKSKKPNEILTSRTNDNARNVVGSLTPLTVGLRCSYFTYVQTNFLQNIGFC